MFGAAKNLRSHMRQVRICGEFAKCQDLQTRMLQILRTLGIMHHRGDQ
jgi:hypothetical protein